MGVFMMDDDYCELCGEVWNSEFHMSDECVNVSEDVE